MSRKEREPPTVYAIAGPNGAGKTTFTSEFLPDFVNCRQFLNADLIAAGLSPFAPETQNLRAGRVLLERIGELAAEKSDFGLETTLAGRIYVRALAGLKENGYRVALFFLWLPSPNLAVTRVENRVKMGGHGVRRHDIRRRYASGVRNLIRLYRGNFDRWWLYDAPRLPPQRIATEHNRQLVVEQKRWYWRVEKQVE